MKFEEILQKGKMEELDKRISLPSGRGSMAYDKEYLDINLVVNELDRELMKRLYREEETERKIDVAFSLDDFMTLELPFSYASSIEVSVTSDVFLPQRENNPLGLIAKEKLRLRYTKNRVELLGSDVYSNAMENISSELGLENKQVRFSRRDLDMVKEWFDAKSQIVRLSPEELHVAEGICGPIGLKKNMDGVKSHIIGLYSDSSDLLNRFRTGTCMLDEARPDERYCRAKVDEPIVENGLSDLMKQALVDPRLMDRVYSIGRVFGIKKGQSVFDVSNMARQYVNYLSLCRFRTRRDGVIYSAQNLPEFPTRGEVRSLEVQKGDEQVRNSFYISRKNQYHIKLRVSKSDPTLMEGQQEILNHLGVSFD
ncbi:MAG: hypothetical protein ACLFP2_05835 [Candidatus Woesearchaeota archaeon]